MIRFLRTHVELKIPNVVGVIRAEEGEVRRTTVHASKPYRVGNSVLAAIILTGPPADLNLKWVGLYAVAAVARQPSNPMELLSMAEDQFACRHVQVALESFEEQSSQTLEITNVPEGDWLIYCLAEFGETQ